MTSGHKTRFPVAALIAAQPGSPRRQAYRTHTADAGTASASGLNETDYGRMMRRPRLQAADIAKVF